MSEGCIYHGSHTQLLGPQSPYHSRNKCLRPGRLGYKPDALTRCWDLYQEEGRNANSSANIQPIFSTEQLVGTDITASATSLTPSENPFSNILDHATILDTISSIILNDDFA